MELVDAPNTNMFIIFAFYDNFDFLKKFKKISAIVCAAGLSTRMEKNNKLLMDIEGQPMIYHCVEQLRQSHLSEIIVVTGHEKEKMNKCLEPFENDIKIIFNERFREGQTSTIQTGVAACSPQLDAIMVCLADMPLLSASHVGELIRFFNKMSFEHEEVICRPRVLGQVGHPVVLHHSFVKEINSCTDPTGCKSVLQSNSGHLYFFESEDMAYVSDIDNFRDYTQLIRHY